MVPILGYLWLAILVLLLIPLAVHDWRVHQRELRVQRNTARLQDIMARERLERIMKACQS